MTACLVADDHPAMRAALVDLLAENGFAVVGPAADGAGAVALAEAEQPELAVVDYRMPRLAGRELLARLKEVVPNIRLLVYTAEADERILQEVLSGGADGIVLKEAPLQDVLRALAAVQAGRTYIDPSLATLAINGPASGRAPLTQRERDVLSRLSAGRSHAEIGEELGISVETVRTHLRKASDKLAASTRTQAVATAIRLGLIE
jgi:DNA-binding NarL/FixJ family response regulator